MEALLLKCMLHASFATVLLIIGVKLRRICVLKNSLKGIRYPWITIGEKQNKIDLWFDILWLTNQDD